MDEGETKWTNLTGKLIVRVDQDKILLISRKGGVRAHVPVFSGPDSLDRFMGEFPHGYSSYAGQPIRDGPRVYRFLIGLGYGICLDPVVDDDGGVVFWRFYEDWETPISPN